MNLQYGYENVEHWDAEFQNVKPAAIQVLIDLLGTLPEARGDVDALPEFSADWETVKKLPSYHYKTGCVDDPAVVAELNARGLHYQSLEIGATRWLVLAPKAAYEAQSARVPLLLVFHGENYDDPFWALKTLRLYKAYVDAASAKQDRTLLFVVGNHAPVGIFSQLITEGVQNYCGDKKRIYVDVSNALRNGVKLSSLEGFDFLLADGTVAPDPDACVERFDGVPVLNFADRWVTPWRAHRIDAASDGTMNKDWLIHSEEGRTLLRQRMLAESCPDANAPKLRALWKQMGLECHIGYIHDERYVLYTPAQTALQKLPVVVCLDEVNEPDDHSVVTAFANYMSYCDIAAQGDCAVLFFAMENPKLNDWISDILLETEAPYRLDLSRVYITGHSHNGHFAQEFARRHPKLIACVAPLGNSPGLPTPAVSHEAVAVDDERAALMETMDMPTCILCGCKEVGCLVPINQAGHAFEKGINVEGYAASAQGKIEMWNRRLKAERCPQQSVQDVLAAAQSPCKATRMLGFPSDHAETQYINGFEHYIADMTNVDGKRHFRVVAIENMPHMVTPSMHQVAWSYMRRFARNRETGEVIELF